MSRLDQNKALVQRAADTHNARDRSGFLACYADALTVRTGEGEEDLVVTPDEHWAAVLAWAERFDGFSEETRQMVAEGDLVFLRSRYSGVHQGEWRGVEPTGRSVEWDAWQVLRIVDGLIVEERMLMDRMGLIEQLGAAPSS
jgi:ketosteroid isomerase-like protein